MASETDALPRVIDPEDPARAAQERMLQGILDQIRSGERAWTRSRACRRVPGCPSRSSACGPTVLDASQRQVERGRKPN